MTPSRSRHLLRSPHRSRADDFARLLDGTATAHLATDPSLAPLATLATALRSLPVGPAPEFRSALRQRLVAVGTVQGLGNAGAAVVTLPAARPQARPLADRVNEWAGGWRIRRRLVVGTAALSAVVLVGGMGLAGSRSLPGEPFYGIKRGVESIQLAAASGDEAKGRRHLQFAATRLREVSALVGTSSALGVIGSRTTTLAGDAALGGSLSSRVIGTLRDMDAETRAGQHDLTRAYEHSRDQAPLRVLSTFASEQSARITDVLPALPALVTPAGQSSLALVQQIGVSTDQLLADAACTSACQATPQTPSGVTMTPGPDATPAPCSCAQVPDVPGATTDPGATSTPAPSPEPSGSTSRTPDPSPSPTASPSPTSLQDQVGAIISHLPVPLPTAPLPVPIPPVPPLPTANPLPTIRLP